LIGTLQRKPVDRPPIWLMRQAGRYLPEYRAERKKAGGVLDLCYTPSFAVEVTLQPLRRFALDAAIIFSDILVIPHALGQEVGFVEGTGPVLTPIRDEAGLNALSVDGFTEHLQPVYDALKAVRAELSEDKALIGFAGAPWTIATYMVEGGSSRDYPNAKSWAITAPESFDRLFTLLENTIADHLIAQINAGAQVIQIFDSWAGALPASLFNRYSLEPIGRIAACVKRAAPDVPIIVFPRLAGPRYRDFLKLDAIDAISIDQSISPEWIRDEIQPHKTVQGNLDPAYLVAGGTAMDQAARDILAVLGEGPFIFNLGHGVVPQTPPENVGQLCDIVSEYRSGGR
jgi:uroporphyrinogen decarboxylase